MARTARAAQSATTAGLAASYTAVDNANGEIFTNNGRRVLHVKNASAGAITVTITDQATIDGQAGPNRVVSVPASGDRFIGPFPSAYNDTTGSVWVDYSAGASVTAALLEAPLVS